MDWIEIIQLSAFTVQAKEAADAAFKQLSPPKRSDGLTRITLFESVGIKNELSIRLHWQGAYPQNGKSPLGRQLTEAFSEFGRIYHSGWVEITEKKIEDWRHHHEN